MLTLWDLQCQLDKIKDCCHDDIHYVSVHIAGHPAGDKKIAVNYLTGLFYFRDVNGYWALYTPSSGSPSSVPLSLTTTGTGAASYSSGVLNIPTPSIPPAYELILTTAGSSGAATYNSGTNTLNIPNYQPPPVNITVNGITPDVNGDIVLPASVDGGENFLAYRALLTQAGTDAPVIIVQENTLGAIPTITRIDEGVYHLTCPVFSLTGCNYHVQSGQGIFTALFVSPNIIEIRTESSDNLLLYTPIEVKVYS